MRSEAIRTKLGGNCIMKKIFLAALLLLAALVITGCGCKHESVNVIQAKSATCTEDGYSGDVTCSECDKVTEKGSVIPAKGHTPGSPIDAYEPNCRHTGYSGDIYCTDCGELIETGVELAKTEHKAGERLFVYEPECEYDGYTGDVVCENCGFTIEEGEVIPALGHTPGDPYDVVEATCLYEGYDGTRDCTVCGEVIRGNVTAKLEHSFDAHVCTVCEWPQAGLYINGELQFTWEELVKNNNVQVQDNVFMSVAPGVYGELVIGEEISRINNFAFRASQLSKVVFPYAVKNSGTVAFSGAVALEHVEYFGPVDMVNYNAFERNVLLERVIFRRGVARLDDACFTGCTALREVELGDRLELIASDAFYGCTSLESIILPEGLESIGSEAFYNCTSLKTVALPSTLKQIGSDAFANCASMKAIALPEGLESMYMNVFSGSGIRELVLPSTLTMMSAQRNMTELVKLDMSRANIREVDDGEMISGCTKLETLLLPETIAVLSRNDFKNCSSLKLLEIPDAVLSVRSWGWGGEMQTLTSLHTIIWPVGLTDGSMLAEIPNLKNILYRGSELQYEMLGLDQYYPDANVIYNYSEE